MENMEENFDEAAHNKLLLELKKLSGKSEKVKRERTVRVSTDAKPSFQFGNILSKIGDQNLSIASRDLKTLPKPLEKPESKRLKRAAGFEELAVDVNRWEGVVQQRRKATQLVFPLKKADVRVITTERNYKPPMKTELEKEIYELMDGANLLKEDEETKEDKEIRKAMTLEEIKLKSKEDWRARILRQRILKKASMLNQSKSRKYRQILRRDRIRSQKEEFERLKTSDPERALEALNEIEQTRLTERMTLRHKNSKWLSGQGSRAPRDFVARDKLKENTELRKELLKKLKPPEEEMSDDAEAKSDIEEEQCEKESEKQSNEKNDDFSSYRKTWVEFYKKKLEERGGESVGETKLEKGGSKVDDKEGKEVGESNVRKTDGMCNGVDLNCNVVEDDNAKCNIEVIESSAGQSGCVKDSDEEQVNGVNENEASVVEKGKSKEGSDKCKVKAKESKKDQLRKVKEGRVLKAQSVKKVNKKVHVMKDVKSVSKKRLKELKVSAISEGEVVNIKNLKDTGCTKKKVTSTDTWVVEVMEECKTPKKSNDNSPQSRRVKSVEIKKGMVNVGGKDTIRGKGGKKGKVNKVNGSDNAMVESGKLNDVADDIYLDDLFQKAEEKVIKKVGEKCEQFIESESSKKSPKKKGGKSDNDNGDKVMHNIEMEFDFRTKDCDSNLDERLTSAKTIDCQPLNHGLSNGVESQPLNGLSNGVVDSVEQVNKAGEILKKDTQTGKPDSTSLVSLDHSEVVQINTRKMGSSRPDYGYLKRKLEEGPDSDGEGEAELQDIFDQEDMTENIREFKAAKKAAEEERQPKDLSIFQQGWGGWTGPGIAKKKNKTKKYRIKAPKVKPNKYSRIGHVIYNEKSDVHQNLRKMMVSDLPYPFTSVEDFEASIRQSTSRKFIPENAHKKLIAPPVVTRMGVVIEPMDEEALLSSSKRNRGASKLEARLTDKLKGRKRPSKTARKSHKKNKVKSLVLHD